MYSEVSSHLSSSGSLHPIYNTQKKTSPLDPQLKTALITLSITAVAGLIIAGLAALQVFGSIGSTGFVAGVFAGGMIALTSLVALVCIAISVCTLQPEPVAKPPAAPPKLPVKPKPEPSFKIKAPVEEKFDRLEGIFWEMQFKERPLHTLLEMAVNSPYESPSKCGKFIVDHFINYMRQQDPSFSYSNEEKSWLRKSIAKQLEAAKVGSYNEIEVRKRSLGNNQELLIHPTVGDGSCGLHALLGSFEFGQYRTNAEDTRKTFCDWLQQCFNENNLPQQIINVLEDYFLNFNLAPSAFRNNVLDVRNKYHANYDSVSQHAQEKKRRLFISDPIVFKAYLNNLRNTGTYLLQEELIAAAVCFNKQLVLHQPGWGNDRSRTASKELTNSGDEVVHIWYNGYNHYERAQIVPASDAKKE